MGWEKKRFFEDIGNREGKNWELGKKKQGTGKENGYGKKGNKEGKKLGIGNGKQGNGKEIWVW